MAELVTCATHGRQRLSKFCTMKPVLDAFGNTIRSAWHCLPDNNCEDFVKQREKEKQAAKAALAPLNDPKYTAQIANVVTSSSSATAGGAADDSATNTSGTTNKIALSDAAKVVAAGQGRYYDLSKVAGTTDSAARPDKKLCFQCGLPGHERPRCPNAVCRRCHVPNCKGTCYGSNITSNNPCTLLGAPPGGFPAEAFQFGDVRCNLCKQAGHIDCAGMKNPQGWTEQCIVCGGEGHSAFKCRDRRLDRWSDDMRRVADGGPAPAQQQGSAAASSATGNQLQRGPAASAGGGAQSASGRLMDSFYREHDDNYRSGGGGGGGGGGQRNNYNNNRQDPPVVGFGGGGGRGGGGDRRHGRDDRGGDGYDRNYDDRNGGGNRTNYDRPRGGGGNNYYHRNNAGGGGGGGGRGGGGRY